MKKWEYAIVSYNRNHKSMELAVDFSNTVMSDIESSAGLHMSTFLKAAGERGWELTSTLLPHPAGKELAKDIDSDTPTSYIVEDPLDIQWLIFKREKA